VSLAAVIMLSLLLFDPTPTVSFPELIESNALNVLAYDKAASTAAPFAKELV
jgi:hypothetical protein